MQQFPILRLSSLSTAFAASEGGGQTEQISSQLSATHPEKFFPPQENFEWNVSGPKTSQILAPRGPSYLNLAPLLAEQTPTPEHEQVANDNETIVNDTKGIS